MVETTDIQIVCQKALTIPLPLHLINELGTMVPREQLPDVITEALTEELKKLRFRKDLKKARTKAV